MAVLMRVTDQHNPYLKGAAILLTLCSAPVHANSHFSQDTLIAQASCQQLLESGLPTWPEPSAKTNQTTNVETLVNEPYENVSGEQGRRFTGSIKGGIQVTWTTIEAENLVQSLQINTAIAAQPQHMWQFDEQCEPTQHRQLIYNAKGQMSELRVLDVEDGSQSIVEPLNPPVPDHMYFPTAAIPLVRVGLIDSGVNYTLPEINNRLARDSNNELIGFDFWEDDNLPFDAHFGESAFHVIRHGTRTAAVLLKESPNAELVAYRHPRVGFEQMDSLVDHAANNGVRILGLSLNSNDADEWNAFSRAAHENPEMLFIASAGSNGRNIDQQPLYPAALAIPNLLVVTSADDLVTPAEGANWGRTHVDYMLPAESQSSVNFFGQPARVSGASYAVPRAMALASRLMAANPGWSAQNVIDEFALRYGQDKDSRYVAGGYIADPIASDDMGVELIGVQTLAREKPLTDEAAQQPYKLPISVFVLYEEWTPEQISENLLTAEKLLEQCNIVFDSVTITRLAVPEHLRDLNIGPAKTLTDQIQNDSEFKPVKVFFARDNHMAENNNDAWFGRANTRGREWLQDSIWLVDRTENLGSTLAHELFHVLTDSGSHSLQSKNLMLAKLATENTMILGEQCTAAIDNAKKNLLLFDQGSGY